MSRACIAIGLEGLGLDPTSLEIGDDGRIHHLHEQSAADDRRDQQSGLLHSFLLIVKSKPARS